MKTKRYFIREGIAPNVKRFDTDDALREGAEKADFRCPKCDHSEHAIIPSTLIGIAPLQMTYEKYPEEDLDPNYVWEELHICSKCNTKFYIENGT